MSTVQETVRRVLKPIIEEALVQAYKQGAEDTIRRFAFVYDTIAKTAKEDVYTEAGAIPIEDIDDAVYEEIERELHPEVFEEVEA